MTETKIDMNRIPQHIAIIMDGNGRWATERGKKRSYGHQAGVESVRKITSECVKLGVKYLTLYTFSTENWNRPADEVAALMGLVLTALEDEIFMKNNVRFRVIGDVDRLPLQVREKLDETMEHTIDMAIVNEFKIMHKIRQKWGLYYVTVYPGDTYDSIAEEFGMKKRKLLDFNDLDRNSEMLHSGAMLYLQEKNERMPDGMPEAHKVKRGETASSIARDYGLKLKSLLHINNLRENDTLTVGTYLRLR